MHIQLTLKTIRFKFRNKQKAILKHFHSPNLCVYIYPVSKHVKKNHKLRLKRDTTSQDNLNRRVCESENVVRYLSADSDNLINRVFKKIPL